MVMLVAVSLYAKIENCVSFRYSTSILSVAVKSAATVHTSRLISGDIVLVADGMVVLIRVTIAGLGHWQILKIWYNRVYKLWVRILI